MTQFTFANNVNTTLAAAVTSSSTTLTLASSNNLPSSIPSGSYFALTLNDAATRSVFEVVYATSISGATVTVIRGQEGTTAQNWQVGDYIYASNTAGILSSFAPVEGSANNPFAVAPASSSAPQNAPQYGQMFQLLTPSASGNITLTALRTIVVPTATSAITLTMQPGTIGAQECQIEGTSYGVTVQSNVSSGSPQFTLPDGSVVYSFPLTTYGASLVLIWDGINWRAQTIGQTVVATTTANNQAPPLSQVRAQFAALNGNGNESFYASELYADSLQGYGIFNESNNSGIVLNSNSTNSVNYANNAYVVHNAANGTTGNEVVNYGQFNEPIGAAALASGNNNTVSATVSFSVPGPGLLIASGSRNNSSSTGVANQVTLYINGNNVGSENSSSSATIFGTATTSGGTVSAELTAALSIPFSARVSLTWIPFGLIT
jgi:hypothetical protein